MSNLIPYDRQQSIRRGQSRQLRRQTGDLGVYVESKSSRIEAEADLQALRVDAVCHVGQRAMQNITRLTKIEEQLSLMVPLASGRLAAIADLTAIAATEVVADTVRRLR